jgi:hypothetical protein
MIDTKNFFNNLSLTDNNFISSSTIFCNIEETNLCYASTGNELFYSDSNHLTLAGANLITNKINEILILFNK